MLLVLSCGNENLEIHDPYFDQYKNRYRAWALVYDGAYKETSIRFIYNCQFPSVGECHIKKRPFKVLRQIDICHSSWQKFSDLKREWLISHELYHCSTGNQDHRNSGIMVSSIPFDISDFELNKDSYYKELFND